MFHQLIVLVCTIQLVLAAPQFVSFKDGKVGVNFGGYHAEAGLGGLLTGNAAHGGLSASAGTPWGPQAAAGLNGGLDGRAAGGAYAGGQLNPEIGASSVISGSVGDGQRGFAGAEAHSNGNHVSKTHGIDAPIQQPIAPASVPEYNAQPNEANSIQKIKPPKKYNVVKSENADVNVVAPAVAHSKQVSKSVIGDYRPPTEHTVVAQQVHDTGYQSKNSEVHVNSGLVGNVLNIPIGILRSLQESLAGFNINKNVGFTRV